MNLQYQYPKAFWLLLALPLFVLLYLSWQQWKRRRIRRSGDEKLIRALYPAYSPGRTFLKFLLPLLAFGAGCVALSNPRKPDPASGEERKGIDLVFALDVSNSMMATDIAPSRMARAKLFISKLIDNLRDDRIGLVVFAGNAYIQMPLTFDQSAARLYVSAAGPAAVPTQGTSIADALRKADAAFGERNDRFRSVILITDGETHDENAADAAKELAQKGIMINTVGIGSVEGATIIDTATGRPKTDESGQVVISKLNEGLLRDLATATNGTYVHLESADAAVGTVLAQYSQIEKKALGDVSSYTYNTFYMWVAVPMLLFLLVELFIPDRKKLKA